MVPVTSRRAAIHWAHRMQELADHPRFAAAEKITVVLDNLNTHDIGSLYEAFPPAEAKRIADSWWYGLITVDAVIGIFVFCVIPKWQQKANKYETGEYALLGGIFGVLTVLFVPFILSWVLPAPVKWFPQEIVDIAETRQKDALKWLAPMARELDEERELEERFENEDW